MLRIRIDFLQRFYYYSMQFLPKEVLAILIGYQEGNNVYLTNFVHPLIDDASETHVRANLADVFRKAAQYYTVGFIHTHPGLRSGVTPSNADIEFHQWMSQRFMQTFRRSAFFLISAPQPNIFGVYHGNSTAAQYEVVASVPTKRSPAAKVQHKYSSTAGSTRSTQLAQVLHQRK